jgi:hypothetical protein
MLSSTSHTEPASAAGGTHPDPPLSLAQELAGPPGCPTPPRGAARQPQNLNVSTPKLTRIAPDMDVLFGHSDLSVCIRSGKNPPENLPSYRLREGHPK